MSHTAEQLDSILSKASILVELCSALQEENDLLKLENQSLKVALDTSKTKNSEIEEKLKALKLARSLEGMEPVSALAGEKTLDIKQKISEFVREIDKCIVLLRK